MVKRMFIDILSQGISKEKELGVLLEMNIFFIAFEGSLVSIVLYNCKVKSNACCESQLIMIFLL